MANDDPTRRIQPWEESTRSLDDRDEADGVTRRIESRPDAEARTQFLGRRDDEPDERIVDPRRDAETHALHRDEDPYAQPDAYSADRGYTIALDDDRYDPPAQRAESSRSTAEDRDRLPRWALPLVASILGFLLGAVVVLLANGGGDNNLVPRQALVDAQAQAATAVQDAQAEISSRDARIAEVEGQLAQAGQNQQATDRAAEQALAARQTALDEREAALNARSTSLDEREQALQDGSGSLPDVSVPDIPGVDLPDVSLPDVEVPSVEESQNIVQRILDGIAGLFD